METNPFEIPPELRDKLEDAFFAEQDRELIERLRQRDAEAAGMGSLETLCGIHDRAILQKLLDLGITPGTLVALSIAPLVEVAWADGRIDPPERRAILMAAAEQGIAEGSDGHALLERWLARRDREPARLEAWIEYTRAATAMLTDEERQRVRERVLGRARAIAEAAGGFLGLHSISAAERRMLERLATAFAAPLAEDEGP